MKLYKILIWSIVTYKAEMWTTKSAYKQHCKISENESMAHYLLVENEKGVLTKRLTNY